ncbi:hypothetical protein [Streptomyces tendae]|uniref:hypothetical protein n=1 Tax=Streptomyces tendae TaxID=1932 RepID=UPI00384F19C9
MTAAGALARFTGRLPARSIDEGVEPRGDGADACARLSAHVCAVAAATAHTWADAAHRGCLLAKGAAELRTRRDGGRAGARGPRCAADAP